VCNRCFETWLLGCKGLYPKTPVEENSYFYQYYNHYNIEMCDPEKMTVPEWARETTAKYHFHYLHELLRYNKIRYSKNKPDYIASNEYFNGIVERIDTTNHLKTFRDFYDYLSRGTTCK
jgi:hypothetical protein